MKTFFKNVPKTEFYQTFPTNIATLKYSQLISFSDNIESCCQSKQTINLTFIYLHLISFLIFFYRVNLQNLPVKSNGAWLAPVITPLVFRTNCWEDPGCCAIVTTGRCALAIETTVELAGLITTPLVTAETVEKSRRHNYH